MEKELENIKSKRRKRGEKALFIVSLVMAIISALVSIPGFLSLSAVKDVAEEAPILLIFIFALPFIFGIASEICAIIAVVNAIVLFKLVRNAKSITMFVITLVELLFLPLLIVLFILII